MKNISVETAVIGGTFTAIGIQSVLDDCIVIQTTPHIGGEYTNCYKLAVDWNNEKPVCSNSKYFHEILIKKNVISAERYIVGAAGIEIFNFIKEKSKILFGCNISEIVKSDYGYRIEFVTSSGLMYVNCRNIIDTNGKGINFNSDDYFDIQFNALVCSLEKENMNLKTDEYSIKSLKNEYLHQFSVSATHNDIRKARLMLHKAWENKPDNFRFLYEGIGLDYMPKYSVKQIDLNFWWVPSCYYKNPTASMEGGERFAAEYINK